MIVGAIVVVAGVTALLYAEATNRPQLRWIAKPLASAGFLLAALGAPAVQLPKGSGLLLFAALALSAIGDVLLVPAKRRWFIAGMASFALAHGAYGAWFVRSGTRSGVLAVSILAMLGIGHLAWTRLSPHVTGAYRAPVRAYVLVVSVMTACALAAAARAIETASIALLLPALGGILFCISDIAVARQRFVIAEFRNRAWGLPLYYLAQLLLATAVLAR